MAEKAPHSAFRGRVLLWAVASAVLAQCHWIPHTCLSGSFCQPHSCLDTRYACVGTFVSLCLPSPQLLKVSSLLTFSLACTNVSVSAVSQASQPTVCSEIRDTDSSVSSDYRIPYSLKARPETPTAVPGQGSAWAVYSNSQDVPSGCSQMMFPLSKTISPSSDLLSNPAPTHPSAHVPFQMQILSRSSS